MKNEQIYSHFEELANQLGVTILEGRGDFEGGYCTVKNDQFVVLNRSRPIEQRLRVLAISFRDLGLGERYIIPALRAFIDSNFLDSPIG